MSFRERGSWESHTYLAPPKAIFPAPANDITIPSRNQKLIGYCSRLALGFALEFALGFALEFALGFALGLVLGLALESALAVALGFGLGSGLGVGSTLIRHTRN